MSKDEQQLIGQNVYKLSTLNHNNENTHQVRLLKDRFLEAVIKGELGSVENAGVVVTLKEFKAYFSDIKTQYATSFMPAATFEPGQFSLSHTKFLFRVRKGAYLIHRDLINPDTFSDG